MLILASRSATSSFLGEFHFYKIAIGHKDTEDISPAVTFTIWSVIKSQKLGRSSVRGWLALPWSFSLNKYLPRLGLSCQDRHFWPFLHCLPSSICRHSFTLYLKRCLLSVWRKAKVDLEVGNARCPISFLFNLKVEKHLWILILNVVSWLSHFWWLRLTVFLPMKTSTSVSICLQL